MKQKSSQMKWANHYFDPENHIPNKRIQDPRKEGAKREIIEGSLNEEKEKDSHLKSIEKIVAHFATSGHAPKGAEYKLFPNTPFSYARSSIKSRFIFMVGLNEKQEAALILVNINDEHNYQKYSETNSHSKETFSRFIKDHKEELMKQGIVAIKSDPEMIPLLPPAQCVLQSSKTIKAKAPLHKESPVEPRIVFSETQKNIINEKGIKIVNGAPGTGKTLIILEECLALELESEVTALIPENGSLASEDDGPWIEVIQPTKALSDKTRQMYEKRRLPNSTCFVQFKDYVTWASAFFQGRTEVGFVVFDNWLQGKSYATSFNTREKRLTLYNEMEIAAGFLEPSFYLEASERTTRLEKEEVIPSSKPMSTKKKEPSAHQTARQTVLEIYQAYIEELEAKGQVDFSLCEPIIPDEMFSKHLFFALDEYQDIPLVIIKAIMKNKKLREIGEMFGDGHQRTQENASIPYLPILEKNFYALTGLALPIKTLEESYRNPKAVTDFAQFFLNVKLSMDKGTNNKKQYATYKTCQNSRPGELLIQETVAFKNLPFDTAIIVRDEATKEALLTEHPTLFVITPHEAKGLEFEHVILYHLLEDPGLAGVEKHLKSLYNPATKTFDPLIDHHKLNRTKDKAAPVQNSIKTEALNRLFAATTRSTHTVIIVPKAEPAFPLLNEQVKAFVKAIMQPANFEASVDESAREESKEGDLTEKLQKIKTETVVPAVNPAERKTLFEGKIASLIAQRQFTLAENYACANQQWHEAFDMSSFVKGILEKTTDKGLRLAWELRSLLTHLTDSNEKQALLKQCEENKYKDLFERIAKLAQNDRRLYPSFFI